MPIYEYRCKKNGHVFEVFQMPSEGPVTRCTQCKSPVEKVVSSSAFHLKGSGWYVTDYKGKDKDKGKKPKEGSGSVTSKEVTPSATTAPSGKPVG